MKTTPFSPSRWGVWGVPMAGIGACGSCATVYSSLAKKRQSAEGAARHWKAPVTAFCGLLGKLACDDQLYNIERPARQHMPGRWDIPPYRPTQRRVAPRTCWRAVALWRAKLPITPLQHNRQSNASDRHRPPLGQGHEYRFQIPDNPVQRLY